MSDGKWSGGARNRLWSRPGSRHYPHDPDLGARLYAQLADEVFWCETCGRTHPLREHAECRAG